MRIISDLGSFTARSFQAGAAYLAVGLGVPGLVFTVAACNTKKERKGEIIPPGKPGASTTPNNVTAGGNQETGGTPGGSGADNYFKPRKRPSNISVDGKERPVNTNDIFITPVYVKAEVWFRTCVKAISGANPLGIGCSLGDASPKPATDMPPLTVDKPVGIPLDKGGQKIALTFESFKSAVVKCTDASARKTSTTGNCPGAVDSISFDTRSTATANSVIKCAKSGDVLVVFYEDQETALVEKNNSFRAGLKNAAGSAPLLPNLKDIFSDPPLTASYTDAAKGAQITEQDVRKKFGVDYQDLILQIDLGSAGNSVAGLESCQ
jgi:hypothetical protein